MPVIGQVQSYQNVGMSAAGGAMSGAAMGAQFGPWGAAIGAVVGGVAGLVTGKSQKRAAAAAVKAQLKAVDAANNANLQALAKNLNEQYKELSYQAQNTNKGLWYLRAKGGNERSQMRNLFLANEQQGSSMQKFLADSAMKQADQEATLEAQYSANVESTLAHADSLIDKTSADMYSAAGYSRNAGKITTQEIIGAIQNGVQAYNGYSKWAVANAGKTAAAAATTKSASQTLGLAGEPIGWTGSADDG